MRIVEDTPSHLVLRDRSLWISCLCFGAALFLGAAVVFAHAGARALLPAGLFALFALPFLRTTDVILDKGRRHCAIRRRDMGRVTRQEIGFDEIEDVLVETQADFRRPDLYTCRLSLATKEGRVPLSAVYEPDPARYQAMRDTLVRALFAGRAGPAAADPVQALLSAGRTVDAIALLRSRDGLGLAEARAKAEEMRNKMAA